MEHTDTLSVSMHCCGAKYANVVESMNHECHKVLVPVEDIKVGDCIDGLPITAIGVTARGRRYYQTYDANRVGAKHLTKRLPYRVIGSTHMAYIDQA